MIVVYINCWHDANKRLHEYYLAWPESHYGFKVAFGQFSSGEPARSQPRADKILQVIHSKMGWNCTQSFPILVLMGQISDFDLAWRHPPRLLSFLSAQQQTASGLFTFSVGFKFKSISVSEQGAHFSNAIQTSWQIAPVPAIVFTSPTL